MTERDLCIHRAYYASLKDAYRAIKEMSLSEAITEIEERMEFVLKSAKEK